MAIIGESIFPHMAWTSVWPISVSWGIELPPSNALAKVGFNFYMPNGDDDMVSTGIMNFSRRLPIGVDEVIDAGNQCAAGDMRGIITTGAAPKVRGISAVALYDTNGTIHHMHFVVTHIGSRDVDPETMIRDAISNATALGRDVAPLQARHFSTVPNPHGMHRVDLATQTLVEVTRS